MIYPSVWASRRSQELARLLIIALLLCPGLSLAATTTLELRFESESFGVRLQSIEFEDGVTQTVLFNDPAVMIYDERCFNLTAAGSGGGIPSRVEIDLTTRRYKNAMVETTISLRTMRAGMRRESPVGLRGDDTICPGVTGSRQDAIVDLIVDEATRVIYTLDQRNQAALSVTLTAR